MHCMPAGTGADQRLYPENEPGIPLNAPPEGLTRTGLAGTAPRAPTGKRTLLQLVSTVQ
jgi:hypothetical protein